MGCYEREKKNHERGKQLIFKMSFQISNYNISKSFQVEEGKVSTMSMYFIKMKPFAYLPSLFFPKFCDMASFYQTQNIISLICSPDQLSVRDV